MSTESFIVYCIDGPANGGYVKVSFPLSRYCDFPEWTLAAGLILHRYELHETESGHLEYRYLTTME